MAKKKTSIPTMLIARPWLPGEVEAGRKELATLERDELEVLLLRAAREIESLTKLFDEARQLLIEQSRNKAKGPNSRLSRDNKQHIKSECEKDFLALLASRAPKRGDRAQFIKAMEGKYPGIEDQRTFGVWWDDWMRKHAKREGSSAWTVSPDWLQYLTELRAAELALPKVLRTLGYRPKNFPNPPKG